MSLAHHLDRTSRDDAWAGVRAGLHEGCRVSGEVVARCPSGLVLDLGVGFPAHLPASQVSPPPRRRPKSGDGYPAVGSTIRASVVAFDERVRQIGLTQLPPHARPASR